GRYNRRHRLCGHVFSGRYKALFVEASGDWHPSLCNHRSISTQSILMKIPKIIFILFLLAEAGCATDRVIELSAPRIHSGQQSGLAPNIGVEVLNETAKKLGLTVSGPIAISASRFEYIAQAPLAAPTNRIWLIMWVDVEHVSFIVRIRGT